MKAVPTQSAGPVSELNVRLGPDLWRLHGILPSLTLPETLQARGHRESRRGGGWGATGEGSAVGGV